MNKNIENVFKMLGVRPNEEFFLKDAAVKREYRITELLELHIRGRDGEWKWIDSSLIADLLAGNREIEKIPKPIRPTGTEQIVIDYARLCGFKYLTKDEDNVIYAHKRKPIYIDGVWHSNGDFARLLYPLSFLSWEDTKPYYIVDDTESYYIGEWSEE